MLSSTASIPYRISALHYIACTIIVFCTVIGLYTQLTDRNPTFLKTLTKSENLPARLVVFSRVLVKNPSLPCIQFRKWGGGGGGEVRD